MDLSKIREQIDKTDDEILKLFLDRMQLCVDVARYKKENNLPVFQSKREEEILARMSAASPAELACGSEFLFQNIMDISKCLQSKLLTKEEDVDFEPLKEKDIVIACPGTAGSNTEQACHKLFSEKDINFYPDFSDVFTAVDKGEADYGVLPIDNSSAGEVSQTYRLLSKYDFYICKRTDVRIKHCLAAKKGSKIKSIYSHEQALMQCSKFLQEKGVKTYSYQNTALAAKMVSESEDMTIAAICSPECAKLYDLQIIDDNIADNPDNTTRFICISKKLRIEEKADTISICVSIPNTSGSLYRMLTRFAFYGLNLSKIESAPVPEGFLDIKDDTFDVIFYLDFEGNINNPDINRLLVNLKDEMKYYKFLGNYRHIN